MYQKPGRVTSVPAGKKLEFDALLNLKPGYYRLALSVAESRQHEAEPVWAAVCFTVGNISEFQPNDLPARVTAVNIDGITMETTLDVYDVDTKYVTYVCTSTEDSVIFQTGCGAHFERLIDGQWCMLPDTNSFWEAVGLDFGSGNIISESYSYTNSYMLPLEPGQYRLVKKGTVDTKECWLAAEFEVSEHAEYPLTNDDAFEMKVSDSSKWDAYEATIANHSENMLIITGWQIDGAAAQGYDSIETGTHVHCHVVQPGETQVFVVSPGDGLPWEEFIKQEHVITAQVEIVGLGRTVIQTTTN